MKLSSKIILLGCLLCPPWATVVMAQPVVSSRLSSAFEQTDAQTRVPVLVYFTDKGIHSKGELQSALDARRAQFSARALRRRAKMGRVRMTFEDLPVCNDYVRQIEATGARPRQRLNWFNATSFEMTKDQVLVAAGLGFVKRIDLLPSYRKALEPETPVAPEPAPARPPSKDHLLNYGPSHWQLHLMNVDVCHDSGYSGSGVLVAMFDNGFRKGHAAFDSIVNSGRLVDERDFVSNADTVDWDFHGTATWSEAGGYVPGQLIGPAYKASWAIYHTEDMSQEMPVEEDYWAAALQRADSIGADIVSSSLGYRNFIEDPSLSYSYEDLDGNTAISSLAARHAAALGIIICNAMGNSGPSIGSLLAPADADSILSVGSVNSVGVIAYSSSRGPTYDGRGKPEICAQGVSDYCADWGGVNSFLYASGTSCATPLVAGACALVLEAHPTWTPMQVREALMMTASRSATPDSTTYGWGIVDAWAAIHYDGSGVGSNRPVAHGQPGLLLSCRPNPVRSTALLGFMLPRAGEVSVSIYDITGRLIRALPTTVFPSGWNEIRWDGRDWTGRQASSGVYICRVNAGDRAGIVKAVLLR